MSQPYRGFAPDPRINLDSPPTGEFIMRLVGTTAVFTIGELARRTGLPVKTIRFYSDEGLLPPTERTDAGYRLYDAKAMARLELVRTLRELGLGLPDVSAALSRSSTVRDLAVRH